MFVKPGNHYGGVLGHETHSEEEDNSQVVGLEGTTEDNVELFLSNSQPKSLTANEYEYAIKNIY